jgi:hypothetical protein
VATGVLDPEASDNKLQRHCRRAAQRERVRCCKSYVHTLSTESITQISCWHDSVKHACALVLTACRTNRDVQKASQRLKNESALPQRLDLAEQVALSRRCGWHNTSPLARRHIMHLHGRFFCLRLGREEEVELARVLAAIAMSMPFAETSSLAGLCINGTIDAQQASRKVIGSGACSQCSSHFLLLTDESWDEQGTSWKRHARG